MIHLPVKEGGVYFLVPDKERVNYGVNLLSAFEGAGGGVHELYLEPEDVALTGQQAHKEVPFGGGVTIQGHYGAFRAHFFRDGGHEGLGHLLGAASLD